MALQFNVLLNEFTFSMKNLKEHSVLEIAKSSSPDSHSRQMRFSDSLRLNLFSVVSHGHLLLPPKYREQQIFCIGLPRSGTHSVWEIFRENFKAAHEPAKRYTIPLLVGQQSKGFTEADISKMLLFRDKYLNLDLEACHYLHHIADLLVDIFPKAKFLLTVREPVSWLESEVNHNYKTRSQHIYTMLEQFRYGRYHSSYKYKALEDIPNVYPISAYLSYWKDHISKVLQHVPVERLMVIDTFKIRHQIDEIASFVDVDRNRLDGSSSWMGKRKAKLNLYDYVDRHQVLEDVEEHCLEFINENVPFLSKYFS